MSAPTSNPEDRSAIVLSGGGARGAYEAGVLAHLFQYVYPELGEDFEFDTVSGTSVGAIHAAYLAATRGLACRPRASGLLDPWRKMSFDDVFRMTAIDLVRFPLRALGFGRAERTTAGGDVLGGVIDVSPVKNLVSRVVPWQRLATNLGDGKPGALCVACTEVNTGRIVVFIDGPLCDTSAWVQDPNAHAICTRIESQHVRASAAIPFVFPAVKIGDLHYLDGGLRANTPLSPALRLRANRVLVVALRCRPGIRTASGPIDSEAITQPTFLLGKLLDILTMDQLEQELRQLDVLNTLLEGVENATEGNSIEHVNEAVSAKRGVPYRRVETYVLRPSEDIGHIAADCYRRSNASWSTNMIARLMTRTLVRGTPREEADLLSYLYFDSDFTNALIELGRSDAKKHEENIYRLLSGSSVSASGSSPTRLADRPCD